MIEHDNEAWIIDAGEHVIHKKHRAGIDSLTSAERLIYCVWVADYGMRNAGDLTVAADVYRDFRSEAAMIAAMLNLPITAEAFALPPEELERHYFARFDTMCDELRRVAPLIPQSDEP